MEASSTRRGGCLVPGPGAATARLLVAGDSHGNLGWLRSLAKLAARTGCAGVVQLGDFGFWPDQRILRSEGRVVLNDRWLDAVAASFAYHGVWLRVLDGNHDAHPLVRSTYPALDNGIRPIRDGVIDWADRGAVWEWAGIRFGALGGAVSIDRALRRDGLSWWPTETISDADVETLARRSAGALDVLFSHDAPMLPPGLRPLNDVMLASDCAASTRQIARAVEQTEPRLLIHGHYHLRYSGLHRATRVEGLASDIEAHRPGSHLVLALPDLGTNEA